MNGEPAVNEKTGAATPIELIAMLKELTARANVGDNAALMELRDALKQRPEIVQHAGDLARLAEFIWIDLATGGDALLKESVAQHLHKLRLELMGAQPTAMERMLVDHVAACYLNHRA